MATIAEQLTSIKASKDAIKKAIQAKGVSCDDVLSSYATRIASIPSAKAEETKTIDITSNGTYNVTPSASGKVLSKVVVNAKVESADEAIIYEEFPEKNENGIYELSIKKFSGIGLCYINVTQLFEECAYNLESEGITLNQQYSIVKVTGGGSGEIKNLYIVGDTSTAFSFVFLTGDPSAGYVNGIIWYYPGSGRTLYGQKF